MSVFEVTVDWRRDEAWPVTVVRRSSDSLPVQRDAMLALDRHELVGRLGVDEADVVERDVVELLRGLSADACGDVLGRALFRDEVRDLFASARSEDLLRVMVAVDDPELRTVRWERLHAPLNGTWRPLALEQRLPFSMYLPSGSDARYPPIGRADLHALVVIAGPREANRFGLEPFDLAQAAADVRRALADVPCDVLATVEGAVGAATLDDLSERLTGGRYTMLHFVCHGARTEADTVLYLEDGAGQIDPVPATELIRRLESLSGEHGLPRFAFLAMCASAAEGTEGALGGLAQRLVRELGMPAVVAMTDRISMATAWDLTAGFYRRLREHGHVDLALAEACAPLAARSDVTVPALYSRLGERPLFSATLDLQRPLTDREMEVGLARLEQLVDVQAPVLRDDFADAASKLRRTIGSDAAVLAPEARADRSDALAALERITVDVTEVESFKALALGTNPPVFDEPCPFMGLAPFTSKESSFFFGRRELVHRLTRRLAEQNFLAVLGPSGSGKSSLVLAGVLPRLAEGTVNGSIQVINPGVDPLTQLSGAASSLGSAGVLVVDQFEELFTHARPEDREPFVDAVLSLVEKHRVILTMRADFWGDCAAHAELRDLMVANQELISPMNAVELRSAMMGQAAAGGLRFEGNLAETVFDDVADEPGAMPLLQHALRELWTRRHGRWLKLEEYRAIGGVQAAIARSADELYRALDAADRARMEQVFVTLTSVSDDVEPGTWNASRRRVRLADLLPAAGPGPTRALLERLTEPRLVTMNRNEATQQTEVEVTHEALIRRWPRLQRWIRADLAAIRTREDLRRAARAWEEHEFETSYLAHHGSRLDDARASEQRTGSFSELETRYLDACSARQAEAELRIRRSFAVGTTEAVLQLSVGIVAMALPLFIMLEPLLFDGVPFPRGSLSAYYYSGLREVFIGSLFAIGVFLLIYKITELTWERQFTSFAGFAVIVSALFPTGRPNTGVELTPVQELLGEATVAQVHYVASAIYILALATVSYYFARYARRRALARYQFACAASIVTGLMLASFSGITGTPDHGLLTGETLAWWGVGASWLLKGLDLGVLFARPPR